MKEHPIIFTTPMVQAILQGQKTQTRRVIIPQPSAEVRKSPFVKSGLEDGHGREIKIKYAPGDLLWVRETWADHFILMAFREKRIIYKADRPDQPVDSWISPLFLPKEFARLWLEVVNVWAERVQEISIHDCYAEGWEASVCLSMSTPLSWYAALWDSLNAKRGYGWDQNPWVWRIEFKKTEHRSPAPLSTNSRSGCHKVTQKVE